MKHDALYAALSQKLRDGEVLFLNGIVMPEIKAKEAKLVLSKLSTIKGYEALSKKQNAACILLMEKNANIEKSFRNFSNVAVGQARNLNLLDVLTYKYLVITSPDESIKFISRNSPNS